MLFCLAIGMDVNLPIMGREESICREVVRHLPLSHAGVETLSSDWYYHSFLPKRFTVDPPNLVRLAGGAR
jgi:hypothetical protein